MKYVPIVFIILALMAGAASATNNPDQRISLLLAFWGNDLAGQSEIIDGIGITHDQYNTQNSYGFGWQLIMPASDNISLIGALRLVGANNRYARNTEFFRQKFEVHGISFQFGIKIYLGK